MNWKEKILDAFAKGKPIQYREIGPKGSSSDWLDYDYICPPVFCYGKDNYRLTPTKGKK